MKYLKLIFENCESHKIDWHNILFFKVSGKRKLLFKKEEYTCKKCEVTLDKQSDIEFKKYGVYRMPDTVFNSVKNNSIKSIEIGGDNGSSLLHVPFKIQDNKNVCQQINIDEKANLHILLE